MGGQNKELLPKNLLDESGEVVLAIAQDLSNPDVSKALPLDLACGTAGRAIFFCMLQRVMPDARWRRALDSLVDRIFEGLPQAMLHQGLYSGIAGVGWSVEFLAKNSGTLDLSPEATDEIAQCLLDFVRQSGPDVDYDLISGLAGIAVFALELRNKGLRKALLDGVIDALDRRSDSAHTGLRWKSPTYATTKNPDNVYNLGLAHGAPGVIATLSQVHCQGHRNPRLSRILAGAIDWVLSARLSDDHVGAFPAMAGGQTPTRLAWCYGDAGVAAALYQAGCAMHVDRVVEQALQIAAKGARRPFELCNVLDPGLCHGAAGLALIYSRLFEAQGSAELLEAANNWYQRTLQFVRQGKPIGGIQAFDPRDQTWRAEPGFLEGAAGVGLLLMSRVHPDTPAWDAPLLTSFPWRSH